MLARWIYTHAALERADEGLAALVRREGPALLRRGLGVPGGAVEVPVETRVGGGRGARRVEVLLTTSQPADVPGGVRIPCRWRPAQHAAFSTFDGSLDLVRATGGGSELALAGRYTLPATNTADHVTATERLARHLVRAISGELVRRPGQPVPRLADRPGRRLRVRDLMTSDPVVVADDLPVRQAALLLLHHGIAAAPVIDAAGRVVGVLSESDLLAREASPRVRGGVAVPDERRRRLATTAGDAASRPVVTTSPDTTVREAARLLLDADVGRLVVVEGGGPGRLVGVIARHDVLRALTRTAAHLEAAVEAELAAAGQPFVRVEVRAAGRVVLHGTVDSVEAAAVACAAAATVDGVVDVDGDALRSPDVAL